METIRVSKGKHFLKKGERLKGLFVILQGTVRVISQNDEFDMEAGSIVGLMESVSEKYLCDYVTRSDCVFYGHPYRDTDDYKSIFTGEDKYVSVFTMAGMRQTANMLKRYQMFYQKTQEYYGFLMESYEEYKRLCNDYQIPEKIFQRLHFVTPVQLPTKIEKWTMEYYERMSSLSLNTIDQFLSGDFAIGIGEILNASCWMNQAFSLIESLKEYLTVHKELLISEEKEDLFQMYFELAKKAAMIGIDLEPVLQKISEMIAFAGESRLYSEHLLDTRFTAYQKYDFYQNELEETMIWETEVIPEEEEVHKEYFTQILNYAGYEQEKGKLFRAALDEYGNLPDILSTSDEVRKLRRTISKYFYEVYQQVFWHSVEKGYFPSAIKMFLNFGFMDEGMVGEDNANSLYDLTDELYRCRSEHVFTLYEWLLSIYHGENEPSRNEFDMDYVGYLNEQKKTGKITEPEYKELLSDNSKKVEYEMQNMFLSTNRATYGKVATFCPVLQEYDIINSVEDMLVTVEKINHAIDVICQIDFSLFYREVAFSDPAHDVNREMIQKEVLPNIILMPNAGSRAMMWQETAGIKKDTSARFLFPIMTVSNVMEMMIEVSGRFRWEMCRKIQGMRWNDITELSLTSEYNDYIQYYKKNHDLSADTKEKIKNALFRSKNNYREVFVRDYQNWIKYESKGSFRLNKVARDILFRYCPFSKEIREQLMANPMYCDLFQRYDILRGRAIRRTELWYERYEKKGGIIESALLENREFYEL
ncbi:MAG: cyclic nucleotide-binding domain-containing protein [Lachnospiraceae bacterium]